MIDALPGPKYSEINTIEGYTEWMKGIAKIFPDGSYQIIAKALDPASMTAIFVAKYSPIPGNVRKITII